MCVLFYLSLDQEDSLYITRDFTERAGEILALAASSV